jgi:hypothetical protein
MVVAAVLALSIANAVPAAAAPLPLPDPKPAQRVVDLYPPQMPARPDLRSDRRRAEHLAAPCPPPG